MNHKLKSILLLIYIALSSNSIFAQNYPDQHHVLLMEDIIPRIESTSDVKISEDGSCLVLADDAVYGYVTLKPDTAESPFNRGLPS